MSTYSPVTKQQETENKISNSVKISKQLMKAELKKRLKSCKEEYDLVSKDASEAYSAFVTNFYEDAKSQVKTSLASDSELTRFRNLYNKFSIYNGTNEDFPAMPNNLSMYKSIDVDGIINSVAPQYNYKEDNDVKSEFLLGRADIPVSLIMPDRPEDEHDIYDNCGYLGYVRPIVVREEIIELYFKQKELSERKKELNTQYNGIELKLRDIDSVAEEMEAQLLVNELSKSEEGVAALEIAGNLVGDMLGDRPALLNMNKE